MESDGGVGGVGEEQIVRLGRPVNVGIDLTNGIDLVDILKGKNIQRDERLKKQEAPSL